MCVYHFQIAPEIRLLEDCASKKKYVVELYDPQLFEEYCCLYFNEMRDNTSKSYRGFQICLVT